MVTTDTQSRASEQNRPDRPPWFGALLRRLHFYAGILVGPFILVAALSGAGYAITTTLEQLVYDHELHAPGTGTPLPLAEQVATAEEVVGEDGELVAVRPAPEPGETTRVMFTGAGLVESQTRAIFIDPVTAEVRGDLPVYGTSGALPLRTWVDQFHRSLGLGDVGRHYSELAASWVGIVAAVGVVLWLQRWRTTRHRRELFIPARARRGHRRTLSWHTSIGIWVALGALFLSATGITWSQYGGANFSELRTAVGWTTPALSTSLTGEPAPDGGGHSHGGGGQSDGPAGPANPATFDGVLAIAQRANIDAAQVEISPPVEPGTAWVVREIKSSFPTAADSAAVDGTTMLVTDQTDFAGFPLVAKLSSWGISLHMGVLFGPANQILLFLLALGIATMVVLGYLMWWKRRPTRGPRGLGGPAPARGVLRGAPWWGLAAIAVFAVAVGWFLPLVGFTLLGFLVLDTVIGLRHVRRRTPAPTGA